LRTLPNQKQVTAASQQAEVPRCLPESFLIPIGQIRPGKTGILRCYRAITAPGRSCRAASLRRFRRGSSIGGYGLGGFGPIRGIRLRGIASVAITPTRQSNCHCDQRGEGK